MGVSSTSSSPSLGGSRPRTMSTRVVLPAPVPPASPTEVPTGTAVSMFRSAGAEASLNDVSVYVLRPYPQGDVLRYRRVGEKDLLGHVAQGPLPGPEVCWGDGGVVHQ